MRTVLITGGTGLIGHRLATLLVGKGYTVNLLSRKKELPQPYNQCFLWDVDKGMLDEAALKNCDYIIHLAGEAVVDEHWSEKRKQQIIDSRVKSANLLFENLKRIPNTVKAFISASAVGYYGSVTQSKPFEESDPPATDYLGNVCVLWEDAARQMETLNIRVVRVRTGIVLSSKGGALEKVVSMAKFASVAAVGTGKQIVPWVHIDDLCNIYIKALEDENMHGAYNAAAPAIDDNTAFSKAVAGQIKKSMLPFPAPGFTIRLLYGERADALLEGSPISSQKVQDAGFTFQHPELKEALRDVYSKRI